MYNGVMSLYCEENSKTFKSLIFSTILGQILAFSTLVLYFVVWCNIEQRQLFKMIPNMNGLVNRTDILDRAKY